MATLLGEKIGMTQIFDEQGNAVGVTAIKAGPCFVTQLKTKEKDGYNAIQVGFGTAKRLSKPAKGHLKEKNARFLREIRVDKPEEYQLGQEIKVDIFQPRDLVSVSGVSIGKGFQGTIKRHHHHRGPMTHGSKSHRITGSIGAGTTPGRVFKGRKMAGHMGREMVTQPNLRVISVDPVKDLILVAGAVPGKPGNLVTLTKTGVAKVVVTQVKEEKAEKKEVKAKK